MSDSGFNAAIDLDRFAQKRAADMEARLQRQIDELREEVRLLRCLVVPLEDR